MKTTTIKSSELDSPCMIPFCACVPVLGNKTILYVQQGGIKNKEITPIIKKSFREVMPTVFKLYPNICNPFFGTIEIDHPGGKVVEIRFLPTLKA